mmetsp:Transcript_27697/g.46863  ORF Transcript_27697/g.46863 Transcript_27697/m.46863 type:complete len:93 (-) Transcript_27697:1092-1370(-)
MTVTKEEPEIAVNGGLPVVTAVGIEEKADEKVSSAAGGGNQGPPIPAGHARFYCNSEFYMIICCSLNRNDCVYCHVSFDMIKYDYRCIVEGL